MTAIPKSEKQTQNGISSGKPDPSRHNPSPGLDADFADFDDDDLEYMDLTRTTGTSDESDEFGEDVKVWTEKDASWEAPLPTSKKRKSTDDAAADSQFPDVYQLLGTNPPVPTPGRSAKKVSPPELVYPYIQKHLSLLTDPRLHKMRLPRCLCQGLHLL